MLDSSIIPHAAANPSASGAGSANAPARAARPARTSSDNLFAGQRELVIEHAGQEYHLRLTRNDRLILTK